MANCVTNIIVTQTMLVHDLMVERNVLIGILIIVKGDWAAMRIQGAYI